MTDVESANSFQFSSILRGRSWIGLRPLILIPVLGYLVLLVMLMVYENRMIYPIPDISEGNWSPDGLGQVEVSFQSEDGTMLNGWYYPHPEPREVVLFCHGNAQDVAKSASSMAQLRDQFQVSILAWDYRGYGKSGGQPSEAGILQDSEAALKWLTEREQIEVGDVIVFGRSLGGAVAVHLASKHNVKALILDRTFDSLVSTSRAHFPWVPVGLLMRNRYDSAERIKNYNGPLLQMHGINDQVVPYQRGLSLFRACPSSDKLLVTMEDWTHNQPMPARCEQELEELLVRLSSSKKAAKADQSAPAAVEIISSGS